MEVYYFVQGWYINNSWLRYSGICFVTILLRSVLVVKACSKRLSMLNNLAIEQSKPPVKTRAGHVWSIVLARIS